MDLNKVKKSLCRMLYRMKRNLGKEQLSEGQKYIRGQRENRLTGGKKKKRDSFGTAENAAFNEAKPRMLIGVGPGFIGYVIFFLFAVVFTQVLRGSISSVLMIFALTWLVFTVIYLIIMFGSVDALVEHNGGDVYKNTPTEFSIKLINHSIFPAPFIEADLRVPEARSLRCVRKRVRVAMYGSGNYEITRRVSFGYRGTYDVGVDTVTVYDLFKIFRVNIRLYNYRSIFVMPRRFTLSRERRQSVSDSQTEVRKNVFGVERSDVAEIRTYLPGDQMKNIHWKLSSKSEELQVKHYSMNSGRTVYIFCDMQAHFDPQKDSSYDIDINEYGIDGVVELAVAAASREMIDGNTCVLVWHDSRSDGGVQLYQCHDNEEFGDVLKMFSTAPVYRGKGAVTELTALMSESQNVSLTFVTDYMDADFVTAVGRVSSLVYNSGSGSCEVLFFDPTPKIHELSIADIQREFTERCKDALLQYGVTVTQADAEADGVLI